MGQVYLLWRSLAVSNMLSAWFMVVCDHVMPYTLLVLVSKSVNIPYVDHIRTCKVVICSAKYELRHY